MRTKIAAGIGMLAISMGALAGCSFEKSVSKSDLEAKSKDAIAAQVPGLTQVKCKGNLKAKAGEKQECAIEHHGNWQLLTATATDDKGKFNVNTVPGLVPQPEWAK
ncbi:MAG: DUF4333 domain-containing protein [Gordonia sp. (in: high G+C Gram-positive bacteria)]|uniref:DUF4333 domain-containing protein n=1 Tax=Gordonia sp. (in: high G+C Gram-positive bacteria) TaxID=84139 RepID=UPI0039E4415C